MSNQGILDENARFSGSGNRQIGVGYQITVGGKGGPESRGEIRNDMASETTEERRMVNDISFNAERTI